jgi:hypothetical protein
MPTTTERAIETRRASHPLKRRGESFENLLEQYGNMPLDLVFA